MMNRFFETLFIQLMANIHTPVAGVEGAGATGQGGQLAGALVQVELDSLPPEAGQGLLLQVAQLVGLGTGS